MDEKLHATLGKIKILADKNPEFQNELRKMFGGQQTSSAVGVSVAGEKIEHIYEYCIEDVLKQQAENFYKDFPIREIVPALVNDFCRMERNKRQDNFEDFCLAAFQQIENITNWFCQREKFIQKYRNSIGKRLILNEENDISIDVGHLIIYERNKAKYAEYQKKDIIDMYFNYRIRAVLFFVYFGGILNINTASFNAVYCKLDELYQCRNLNHRGGVHSNYQESLLKKILPEKYLYYLKFTGVLVDYVEHICVFMSQKEYKGVVDNVLENEVILLLGEGERITIASGRLYSKVKNCKVGDEVIAKRNVKTNEIIDISKVPSEV